MLTDTESDLLVAAAGVAATAVDAPLPTGQDVATLLELGTLLEGGGQTLLVYRIVALTCGGSITS